MRNYTWGTRIGLVLIPLCVAVMIIAFDVWGFTRNDWQDQQTHEWPQATAAALRECTTRRVGEQVMPASFELIFECRDGVPKLVSR